MEDEGARERLARFGMHVVALNRNPLLPPAEIPPMAPPRDLQTNTQDHLSSILNRVQVHKCSDSYCLRKVKATHSENPEDPGGDSVKKCRFHFPRPLRDEAVVDKSVNPKHFMFSAARNHDRLNNYNPLLTMAWLANTDVSALSRFSTTWESTPRRKRRNQPRIRIY